MKRFYFLGLLSLAFQVPVFGATTELTDGGVAEAVIVISSSPVGCVSTAVGELNEYVEKMTGTTLPVLSVSSSSTVPLSTFTGGKPAVLVGQSVYTDNLGISASGLAAEGFRIESFTGGIAIVGVDESGFNMNYDYSTASAGTLYGVYRFLEELGCRWFYPDEQWEVVPSEPTLVAPDLDIEEEPYFEYRFAYGSYEWRRRAGYGGTVDPWRTRHTFELSRMEDLYGDTYPDLVAQGFHFPIPGVMDLVIDQASDYLTTPKHPGRNYFLVLPSDAYEVGNNPYCQPYLTPERGPKGEYSDLIGWAVMETADAVSSLPGKIVYCAYEKYRLPPLEYSELPDNVVLLLAQPRVHFNDPDQKQEGWDLIDSWQSMDPPRMYFCRYYEGFLKLTPSYAPRMIAEDIKRMKQYRENDTLPFGGEMNYGSVPADHAYAWWFCLNEYVTARLLWNPDLDIDELLEDYFDKFYGPAATPMEAFFERLEELYHTPSELHLYSLDTIDELEGYLQQAQTLASTTPYQSHVDYIDQSFDAIRAIRVRMENEPAGVLTGPVSTFSFDEGEGTSTEDAVRSVNATITDAEWVGGISGNALRFNGSSSIVSFPIVSLSGSDYTLSLWVKPEAVTFDLSQYLIGSEAWDRHGISIEEGVLRLIHRHDGGSWATERSRLFANSEEIKPYEWHHIVATFSDENGMAIFLNGTLIALDPTLTIPSEYGVRFIGAAGESGPTDIIEYFDGIIDEIKIYDREITFSEIRQLYLEPEVNHFQEEALSYLTPDADTYVTSGSSAASQNNGDSSGMWVRYYTNSNYRRSSYVRFDLSNENWGEHPTDPVKYASFTLRMGGISSGRSENRILVYALNHDYQGGSGLLGQNWGELTLTGNNAPVTWLQGQQTNLDDLTLVGDFMIPDSANSPPAGTEFTIRGESLVDFLNASLQSSENYADLITFVVFEESSTSGNQVSWITKEHEDFDPASLELTVRKEVDPYELEYLAPDADAYVDATSMSGNFGAQGVLRSQRSASGSTTRMSYVRFNLTDGGRGYMRSTAIEDAELTFRYSSMYSGKAQNTALVYAIDPSYQGDASKLGQDWDELALAGDNAPWDPSASAYSALPSYLSLVGSFTTPAVGDAPAAGTEFSISGEDLTDFLNESLSSEDDHGNLVTFIITEEQPSGSQIIWSAKEHASLSPTSLTLWVPGYVYVYEYAFSTEGGVEIPGAGGNDSEDPGSGSGYDVYPQILRTAFGMDSHDNASSLPSPEVDGHYPMLTYRQLRGGSGTPGVDYSCNGFRYYVEVCTNLAEGNWVSGSAYVEQAGPPVVINGEIERVSIRSKIPVSEGQPVFMRLKVINELGD